MAEEQRPAAPAPAPAPAPSAARALEAAPQARAPLAPPPFIAFPFSQLRPPPFWPMQDHLQQPPGQPHGQFLGIRTPQFAVPDLHSHPQPPAKHGAEGGGGLPLASQFASRNFPPEAFSVIPSMSAHAPATGLQLFSESPESSLLDPQNSSPPLTQSAATAAADMPRVGFRAQTERAFSTTGATGGASIQDGGFPAVAMYPPPLASHEDVVADRRVFYDTLAKLHAFLGLQPRVPKLAGKELDLHTLYREVTARGGLQQVVKLNTWKDVMAVLDLPPRVSSFFIRKHYTNLLHHYEQVYYFKTQGHIIPSPAPLPSPHPVSTSPVNDGLKPPVEEDLTPSKRRKKKPETFETFGVDPGKSVGRSVTGAIEGKFEHGYLVTVVVGKEKMRGVLYHVPSGSDTPQFAALPELLNKVSSPQTPVDSQLVIRHKKSKNGDYLKKDPNAPRSSRSGYNFFFAEQRTKMKDYHPGNHTEITKMIGELWRQLTPEQRLPYLQKGQRDKERYRSEKKEYLEKSKMLTELGDENVGRAHSESLDDLGHGAEQLEHDGNPEFGVGNDGEHDYHVSLDTDLDAAAFHQSQEQGIQTQAFRDYVPDQLEYSHDQGYQLLGQEDHGQDQEVYADQQEGYEEDDAEAGEDVNDDDGNDDDDYDGDDDGGGHGDENGGNAQEDGLAQGF